jgi:hypothetical protein
MKDRLGTAQVWNAPIRNETQNMYRRFVKTPHAGLPDFTAKYKTGWDAMKNLALKSRVEEM